MEINEAIDKFIARNKSVGNSKETIQYYKRNLNLFVSFTGNVQIETITEKTFIDYQCYLIDKYPNTKSTSLRTYARAAKVFIRWLNENNYANVNTEKLVLLKAEQTNIFPLTDSEIALLLNSFDETFLGIRNKLICLLMLDSGLRRGEVVSLKRDCILISNKTMKVFGKGAKERLLPFGTMTCKYIKKFITISNEDCNYLIQNIDGDSITENTIKMFFNKLKKNCGIERIYPHLLRHTFATNYLLDGGNLEELRILMGHTTIEMTRKYVHLAEQQKILNQKFISHIDKIVY